MKNKILLLLISGFLIAGMAGSAMASYGAKLMNADGTADLPTQIDLANNGGSTVASYLITGVFASPTTFAYPIKSGNIINAQVEVAQDNGKGVSKADDITVEYIDHPTFIVPTGTDYLDKGNIRIILNSDPQVVGTLYSVLIPLSETSPLHITVVASTSVVVKNVPEFPTVAAPVAGILGLLFIIGRKKGDL